MTVQQASLLIGAVASIFIPMVFTMLRLTVKWTKVETALAHVSARLDTLIAEKNHTHEEIAKTIREDRKTITDQLTFDRQATDHRLRWLEERIWKEKTNALHRT